jgi:hypothetical protein
MRRAQKDHPSRSAKGFACCCRGPTTARVAVSRPQKTRDGAGLGLEAVESIVRAAARDDCLLGDALERCRRRRVEDSTALRNRLVWLRLPVKMQRVRCDASSEQSCGTCSREMGLSKTRAERWRRPEAENEAQGRRRGKWREKWGGLSGKSVWGLPLFFVLRVLFNVLARAAGGTWLMRGWRVPVARAAVRVEGCLGGDNLDRERGKSSRSLRGGCKWTRCTPLGSE